MDHHAAVAEGPARPALALFTDESILDVQFVVGKLRLVEEMPELAVELGVLVVGDFQDSVFDTKCVAEILAGRVALDFGFPAVQVFAIEERDPAIFTGRILPEGTRSSEPEHTYRCREDQRHDESAMTTFF